MSRDVEAAPIRACRLCRDRPWRGPPLPNPRPILQVSASARLVIASQAPGARAHASGVPFQDPSGTRLRDWLRLDEARFYDAARVAILPMGFCFPGHDAAGGDRPPRPECAATWHDALFARLPAPRLLVAVGAHAQRYHLARAGRPDLAAGGLTATVARWRDVLGTANVFPLPHPSWRNNGWLRRHPWFEEELLPALRRRVEAAIG